MNTKDILTEWNNFINNNLLLEISEKELTAVIGEDDYKTLVKLNKQAERNNKFIKDENFLQVIIRTYESNQNHSIEDIVAQYKNYKDLIAPSWNISKEAKVDVPGGYRGSLSKDKATYDDMLIFFDAKNSMNLKSKVYINCLRQGPDNPDFKVIINDSDWIICYPKTIRGSISLARSFWNGSELEYDKSVSGGVGKMIGKMNWCTSLVPNQNRPSGNMFLNYHRAKNLHMYYCIKKNMNIEDLDRKLCISFKKEKGKVSLMKGSSSVNGNNTATSEEEFRKYIGERFDALFKDAEKPERLEIDEEAYYESISLDQYKILRAANEDNLEDFLPELEGILEYSRDRKKILLLAAKEKHKSIKHLVALDPQLIEVDPTGELIKKLAQDEDKDVRITTVEYQMEYFLQIDPSGELIKKVASDEDSDIRTTLAMGMYELKLDPTGELIKQLATDEDENVRAEIANLDLLDLLEVDPSGEIIKQLATDEYENVRAEIANLDLLQVDPSGELTKQLAIDSSSKVRKKIARRKDLLQVDPSGEIIRKLAQDPEDWIRTAINRNYDLSKLQINTNESLLRSYIKYLL
jgi:hypothetical protein